MRRSPRRKGGDTMSRNYLDARRAEALALLRKGGLSAKIAFAFLAQHPA